MWTKAELAKLTVEQQEVLARFELSITRQRQKLLEEARGCRGSFLRNVGIAALIGIPLGAIFIFVFSHLGSTATLYASYVLDGLIIVNVLICVHTARINQRLDALLKLLDFDHQRQNGNDSSKRKAD
jgi:hypothetical protein